MKKLHGAAILYFDCPYLTSFSDDLKIYNIWKLLQPAAPSSYCLYTILFLWPGWTNLCFEIGLLMNLCLDTFLSNLYTSKNLIFNELWHTIKKYKINFLVWLLVRKAGKELSVSIKLIRGLVFLQSIFFMVLEKWVLKISVLKLAF